jgi:plasmid stabilization system protein ParE
VVPVPYEMALVPGLDSYLVLASDAIGGIVVILTALAAAALERLRKQIGELIKQAGEAADEARRQIATALKALRSSGVVAALVSAAAFLAALLSLALRVVLTLEDAVPVLSSPPSPGRNSRGREAQCRRSRRRRPTSGWGQSSSGA